MTRTDTHRPTAVEPTEYTFIDAFDMGNWEGNQDPHYFGREVDRLEAQGYRVAEHLDSQRWAGRCGTCGQRGLTYIALMLHRTTGEFMVVGSTCISSTFEAARLGLDAKQAAAAQARKEAKLLKAFNEAVAAEPVLASAVAKLEELRALEGFEWRKNAHTLQSIVRKCRQYGNGLTEGQTGFVAKLMTWIDEDIRRAAEWEAERAAERAVAADAPTGRVVVTGEIVSAKWHDNGFDTVLKITVVSDEGYRVWCSIPSDLKYTGDMYARPEDVKGKRVQMTVTLKPSEDDVKFAFGTRAAKAKFVA